MQIQDNSPLLETDRQSKRYWRTAFALLVLLSTGFTVVSILSFIQTSQTRQQTIFYPAGNGTSDFGVVVDLGSSGSRAQIFSYPHRATTEIAKLSATPCDSEFPPVANWAQNLGDVSEFADSVMECVNSLVPIAARSITPVLMFGTAGLRLLPENEQHELMVTLKSYLQHKYPAYSSYDIRVIDGADEAFFGWLTVNYAAGSFENSEKTVGMLDMGGQSTQIAFVPSDFSVHLNNNAQNTRSIILNDRPYVLYANSFLHFGLNGIDSQVNQIVVDSSSSSSSFTNPCYNTGYSTLFNGSSRSDSVNITGSSDVAGCNLALNQLYNTSAPCPYTSCSFNGVYSPHISVADGPFYGISGFWYQMDFLLQINASITNTPTLLQLQQTANQVCTQSYPQLLQQFAGTRFEKYLSKYCLDSLDAFAILSRGYGLPQMERMINFTSSLNGFDVSSWTLGAMLWETTMPAYSTETISTDRPLISPKEAIISLSLLGTGIAVCLVVLYISWRMKQDTERQILLSRTSSIYYQAA